MTPTDGLTSDSIAVDAPPAPGTVTVTVTIGGAAVMGVTVYFQNADSTVVAEQTTDASGLASTVMAAGGYVTALVSQPAPAFSGVLQQVQIFTFAGVKPGDNLRVDQPGNTIEQQVTFTAGPSVLEGATYTLYTTCADDGGTGLGAGSADEAGTAEEPTTCTTANVSVWAHSGASSLVATNTAVTIASSVVLTTNFVTPSSVALTYMDVPGGITGINATQSLHTLAGTLATPNTTPEMTVTANAASGTLLQTTLTGAQAITTSMPDFGAGAIGAQEILELGATSATYSLDVGTNVLHEYASMPAYTAASHDVGWTEGATGVAPDFSVTALSIARIAGETENEWLWTMAAPRASTTVTLPVLPTDIYDYNGGATDTVSVIALDELKVPGGYDAVRPFVFGSVDPSTVLGTAGRASHQGIAEFPETATRHRGPARWFTSRFAK